MSVEEDYSPIGFIRTPAPVQTLQWSSPPGKGGGAGEAAGLRLLVCCADGSMMEVEAPVKGQYDTAKTYNLDPLTFTTRKFASIKDKLRVSMYFHGYFGHWYDSVMDTLYQTVNLCLCLCLYYTLPFS